MPKAGNLERDVAAVRGRVAENTWTARLVTLLTKNEIAADFERTFSTHQGERKPDLVIDLPDGKICVGSAKLGGDRELDALSSAQEYQQSIGRTYPLKETIAIVYPKKAGEAFVLRVLATSIHEAASWRFPELGKVAAKIQELVQYDWALARTGHESEEVSMIRLLRRGVEELEAVLQNVPLESIEAIFGGKMFFQTVLGLEDEKEIPVDHLKTAAAYLLVNQIVFYERLARETKKFPQIDEESLNEPSEIQSLYFAKVLLVDYQPIYGFDIVSLVNGIEATSALKKVLLALRALAPHNLARDILGKVFHELIPLELRKTVAAYFTNASAANLLAALTIFSPEAQVLDAACGSGSLLVAAYQQKAELVHRQQATKQGTERLMHKRFVEEDLTGIDIMPFSAHLAAVQLALQAPLFETDNVRILVHDSTALKPGVSVSSVKEVFHDAFAQRVIDSYTDDRGGSTVSLAGSPKGPVRLERVDVVLMNPPFTRHERLPPQYKKQLKDRFSAYGEFITGQIPLHGYFLFLADTFLKDHGNLGLVLPATTLNLNSLTAARGMLASRYQVHALVTTFQRAAFSEDTEFREVLLIASKEPPKSTERVGIFFLKKMPTSQKEAVDLAAQMSRLRKESSKMYKERLFDAYFVGSARFSSESENWFKFVSVSDIDLLDFWDVLTADNERLLPFRNLHRKLGSSFLSSLRIERNTLISTPSTFVVQNALENTQEEDRWFAAKIASESVTARSTTDSCEVVIPQGSLMRGLRRGSGVRAMDVTKHSDFVVVRDFDDGEAFFKTSRSQYANNLEKWRKKAEDRLANLALFRRFDLSAQGTSHIAFYGEQPFAATDILLTVKGLPAEQAKIITMWLNSTPNLLQILLERVETRGSYLETPVFVSERLLVPDLSKLTHETILSLLKTFDEVRGIECPSIIEQLDRHDTPRLKIDLAILQALGFPKKDLRSAVYNLHKQVLNEILRLKTLMNPQR